MQISPSVLDTNNTGLNSSLKCSVLTEHVRSDDLVVHGQGEEAGDQRVVTDAGQEEDGQTRQDG